MTVGLEIDNLFTEVGSQALLHSFFSTISFHLEPDGWGTRFPELTNDLYQGRLEPDAADKALADARTIRDELGALPPERVVWDIGALESKPPWGDDTPARVTNLAHYHTTSTNRVLMDELVELLEFQVQCRLPLSIMTLEAFYARGSNP